MASNSISFKLKGCCIINEFHRLAVPNNPDEAGVTCDGIRMGILKIRVKYSTDEMSCYVS